MARVKAYINNFLKTNNFFNKKIRVFVRLQNFLMKTVAFFALQFGRKLHNTGVIDVVGDGAIRNEILRDVHGHFALARLKK